MPDTPDNASPAPLTLAPPPIALLPAQIDANERFRVRVWCTFVFTLCVAMLGTGLWLTPNPIGVETHTELGLPPCGFLRTTGYPCPTCGCTTAVSYFAHGRLFSALATQPFGFFVALVAAILVPLTFLGMLTGRWRGPSMFTLAWHWRTGLFGSLAILILGWIYKAIMIRTGHG